MSIDKVGSMKLSDISSSEPASQGSVGNFKGVEIRASSQKVNIPEDKVGITKSSKSGSEKSSISVEKRGKFTITRELKTDNQSKAEEMNQRENAGAIQVMNECSIVHHLEKAVTEVIAEFDPLNSSNNYDLSQDKPVDPFADLDPLKNNANMKQQDIAEFDPLDPRSES